mmetsp:Transcript_19531/g.23288  ORF Transcript_19531/g.23288 Transcript_19531/m.23288 type:complete len:80 (-) Transcript_19531:37-276(-)
MKLKVYGICDTPTDENVRPLISIRKPNYFILPILVPKQSKKVLILHEWTYISHPLLSDKPNELLNTVENNCGKLKETPD